MELVKKIEPVYLSCLGASFGNGYPIEYAVIKHDINDLLQINLEPSRTVVRPVANDYHEPSNCRLADESLRHAFDLYRAKAASARPFWYGPRIKSKWDKVRWQLHLKLLRWKVIV